MTVFFSRVVNQVIYATLAADPVVGAVPGGIQRGTAYRQGTTLPGVLFYMEQAQYDAGQLSGAEHLDGGSYRYVVRVDGAGSSDTDIAPIAEAQLVALAGLIHDTDDGEQVTFTALGELPLPSYIEDGDQYQRLGTIYSVDVTRG